MSRQAKTITREQLYEEIWRTPMSKLAAAWGVSFASIAEACKRMNVPRPATGHWQLVSRGRPVNREPLPPADADTLAQAVLEPTPNRARVDDVTRPEPSAPQPTSDDPKSHLAEEPASCQAITESEVNLNADARLSERRNALDAFDKLEMASRLIREALAERPSLQVLELTPLLRALTEGMQILALKDSELDLPSLMMKHEWFIGQRFYVRAKVQDGSASVFVVLFAQDIPESVVISDQRQRPDLCEGQVVSLDLEIRRKHSKAAWHIRAIDLE